MLRRHLTPCAHSLTPETPSLQFRTILNCQAFFLVGLGSFFSGFSLGPAVCPLPGASFLVALDTWSPQTARSSPAMPLSPHRRRCCRCRLRCRFWCSRHGTGGRRSGAPLEPRAPPCSGAQRTPRSGPARSCSDGRLCCAESAPPPPAAERCSSVTARRWTLDMARWADRWSP